jgi:hypothetical protein
MTMRTSAANTIFVIRAIAIGILFGDVGPGQGVIFPVYGVSL